MIPINNKLELFYREKSIVNAFMTLKVLQNTPNENSEYYNDYVDIMYYVLGGKLMVNVWDMTKKEFFFIVSGSGKKDSIFSSQLRIVHNAFKNPNEYDSVMVSDDGWYFYVFNTKDTYPYLKYMWKSLYMSLVGETKPFSNVDAFTYLIDNFTEVTMMLDAETIGTQRLLKKYHMTTYKDSGLKNEIDPSEKGTKYVRILGKSKKVKITKDKLCFGCGRHALKAQVYYWCSKKCLINL